MARRGAFAVLICLAVAVAAASVSCAARESAVPVVEPEPLSIAVLDGDPLAGLVRLADTEGAFAARGLDVTLVPVTDSPDALRLLLEGGVDLATATDTPIALAVLGGHEVRLLASIGSAANDTRIVAPGRTAISGVTDLRGRRIATVRESTTHYLLHALLETEGVAEHEVSLVFGTVDELPALLSTGEVEAVATSVRALDELLEVAGPDATVLRGPEAFARTLSLVTLPSLARERASEIETVLLALIEVEQIAIAEGRADRDTRPSSDTAPPVGLRVSLGQADLISLEDQARWILGSCCFLDLPADAVMPNFLHSIDLSPLAAAAPDRVTVIR